MNQEENGWVYCRIDVPAGEHDQLMEQKKRMMDYAKQLGFKVVGVSQDTGSGLDFKRNGLAEVEIAAAAGEMKALFIASFSRIGRDAVQAMDFIHRLNEKGVKVYSSREGEIKTSVHDAIFSHLYDAFINLYNAKAMGFPYLEGYIKFEEHSIPHFLKVTPINIAAFVAKNVIAGSDVLITTPLGKPFIVTNDGIIEDCSDQAFLKNELLPLLNSMLQGETEIPDVEVVKGNGLDSPEEADSGLKEAGGEGINFKL